MNTSKMSEQKKALILCILAFLAGCIVLGL